MLALFHPSLNLLGISTVHGNNSLDWTTKNALRLLSALGREDCPVYAGAAKPFCRQPVHAYDIHGTTGLDGTDLLPLTSNKAVDGSAILAMRDAILQQEESTMWLVATGALTNVALLFSTFPELVERLKGLSIMGGAVGGNFTSVRRGASDEAGFGNTTDWAEFNVYVCCRKPRRAW